MEPTTARAPSPVLSAMTGLNIVFAIWAMIGMFGLMGMVKLVGAPEVWGQLAPTEQAALAELARLPRWLLFGMLGSLMLKATLYCLAAFGYFTRSKAWGRGGGTALAVWLIIEQVVLVTAVGHGSWGVVAAAVYAVFTLWMIHFGAREAFGK